MAPNSLFRQSFVTHVAGSSIDDAKSPSASKNVDRSVAAGLSCRMHDEIFRPPFALGLDEVVDRGVRREKEEVGFSGLVCEALSR